MGKRKSSKKPQTRAKLAVLDKTFRCLFCQHKGTVSCKLDQKNKIGRLDCKDCGQTFSADINHLTEPIDVYSEWIDRTEEANLRVPGRSPPRQAAPKKRAAPARDPGDYSDDDDLPDVAVKKARQKAPVEDVLEEEDLPEIVPRRAAAVADDEEDD